MACTERDPMFKQRHFDDAIIMLCVRWHISYERSYRDLAEFMLERGRAMAHSTINLWVRYHVPEFGYVSLSVWVVIGPDRLIMHARGLQR